MQTFMNWIVGRFIAVRDLFYKLYEASHDAFYIPETVAHWFYELYKDFRDLAWEFTWFFESLLNTLEAVLNWDVIKGYIQGWFYYLSDLSTVFAYFWHNVTNVVTNWWASIGSLVQGWIDDASAILQSWIDSLFNWLSSLQASWDAFKGKIPSIDAIIAWWSNWWSLILAQIIAWGALRASEIDSLIESTIRDWFPFYESLAGLWNSVAEFITDPLEWLWTRFADWFLGGE